MPALDALEASLGGEHFEVVAVNIDTRDSSKPHAWLEEVGVNRLAYYADPSAKVFQFKLVDRAFGLPTTVLVDPAARSGRQRGERGRPHLVRAAALADDRRRHRGAAQDQDCSNRLIDTGANAGRNVGERAPPAARHRSI